MNTAVSREKLEAAIRQLRALGSQGVDEIEKLVRAMPESKQVRYLAGLDQATQKTLGTQTGRALSMVPGIKPKDAMRFALKNPAAKGALRLVPGLSALGLVADTADVVAGEESLGNRLADALAMTAAGTAGFVFGGGPIGATASASAAKAGMDGLQRLLGADKYSEEQRRLEEALAMLQRGMY